MNNKHITVVILTIIVAAAAIIVSQQRAPQTSREKIALFPELAEQVNDVSKLVIRDARNTLTIRRAAGNWSVAEADDYPALVDEVKQTVLAVSDLTIIGEKTKNPDLYQRLGVEDPDNKGATSHSLTLTGNEDEVAGLIVGKARRSKSAAGAPGLYVRIPGQPQALLVEGRLSVSADIIHWIKRDVIDIEGDRVSAVRLQPADGTEVFLTRENLTDDLMLQDVPEGKEQESDYQIGRMATVLENVYVEGVKNEENMDFTRPAAIVNVTTFDGLTADIEVVKNGDQSYARFSFTGHSESFGNSDNANNSDNSDSWESTDDTSGETGEGEELKPTSEEEGVEPTPEEEEVGLTPEEEARALNSLVRGWAYLLSTSKAELYNQTLSDLVRDPAADGTGETE